jgi:CheY-like chemotaxis protein
MKEKLKCILLIDDNKYDNYFHERAIKQNSIAGEVIAITVAQDAIDFLKTIIANSADCPDLILLDINMPGMDGWYFLYEYQQLVHLHTRIKIFMVTTSINPDDVVTAKSYSTVSDFIVKPLYPNDLIEKISKHFNNEPYNSA